MPTEIILSPGVELIAAERARQITAEGWTPEHDDTHRYGELAKAAACYATVAMQVACRQKRGENIPVDDFCLKIVPNLWPWESHWWKPSNSPIRNLEKAGALIAAEIDRLQRRK